MHLTQRATLRRLIAEPGSHACVNEVYDFIGEKDMITCAEIMTQDPQFCVPYSMCSDVAKTMRDYNVGPIPVVDAADTMHLLGIVTDRDLAVRVMASNKNSSRTPIAEIMTTHPVACKKTDDVQRALKLMEDCQVRRLPVVDEQLRLIGIISQADIATRLHDPKMTAHLVEEISDKEPNNPHVVP